MSNREVLTTSIPWYRTRLFWGVTIAILILMVSGYYSFFLHNPSASFYNSFVNLSIALGMFAVSVPLIFLELSIHGTAQVLLYYLIMLSLLYMTFRKTRVAILYPTIFVVLFVLGSFFGIGYLHGL
jgi:hypothetical protein